MARKGLADRVSLLDQFSLREDDMTIRIVVLVLTLMLAALTQSPGVSAQKGSKVYRLGFVSLQPPPTQSPSAGSAFFWGPQGSARRAWIRRGEERHV
jgi:hypothetical protein